MAAILRSLLASAQRRPPSSSTHRSKRHPRRPAAPIPALNVVPCYSVPILDTNIILSSLSFVASIVESLRWIVAIHVPVIMELDGLFSVTSSSERPHRRRSPISPITSDRTRCHSKSRRPDKPGLLANGTHHSHVPAQRIVTLLNAAPHPRLGRAWGPHPHTLGLALSLSTFPQRSDLVTSLGTLLDFASIESPGHGHFASPTLDDTCGYECV